MFDTVVNPALTPSKPYRWEAIMRDATVLTLGKPYKGMLYTDPNTIPAADLRAFYLRSLREPWRSFGFTIPPGARLEYALTRDTSLTITGEGPPVPSVSEYVAVRAGYVSADGVRKIKWATPDGRLTDFTGTYEELATALRLA